MLKCLLPLILPLFDFIAKINSPWKKLCFGVMSFYINFCRVFREKQEGLVLQDPK